MSQSVYISHSNNRQIVDTLRISEHEAAAILEAMNSSQHDLPMAELRDSDRLVCRPNKGIVVQIQHPGGSGGMFLVWPRNISRTGMSFLHGNFIYPQTTIVIHLRRPTGPTARITGKVVRCRHVGGVLHELGIKFDQALDTSLIAQYCRKDCQPCQNVIAGQATPRLAGRVLIIDDCIDDRELLNFICVHCGLECTEAAMLEEAHSLLQSQMFDLIFSDVELNDGSMEEIVSDLRAARYPGPVMGLWQAANAHIDKQAMDQAGFSDLLTKPYDMGKVVALLSKYLDQASNGRRSGPLLSEQWDNEEMRPLILSFLGRLETQAARLQSLAEREPGQDMDSSLLKVCLDMQSTCGSYGFPTISDAANELYHLAENEQSETVQLKTQIERLNSLIRSACLVRQRMLNK